LNKVGCKAIVMSESYKNQNYIEMLKSICPEIDSSQPGSLNSKRVPNLKNAILIGKNKAK
jgi:hypothetical protein